MVGMRENANKMKRNEMKNRKATNETKKKRKK